LLDTLPQTILLVTHDVAFAARLTHRAVFFDHGRIVAAGPIQTIVRENRWTLD